MEYLPIDFFGICSLYQDDKEFELMNLALQDIKQRKQFHRIQWLNGNQKGLGFFDAELYPSKSEEKETLQDQIKLGIVYQQSEELSTIIAICSIKLCHRVSDFFSRIHQTEDRQSKKDANGLPFTFFIAPLGFNLEPYYNSLLSRRLSIKVDPFLIQPHITGMSQSILNEYEKSHILKQIAKQLIKVPIFFAIKHDFIFNSNSATIKIINKESFVKLLKKTRFHFLLAVLLPLLFLVHSEFLFVRARYLMGVFLKILTDIYNMQNVSDVWYTSSVFNLMNFFFNIIIDSSQNNLQPIVGLILKLTENATFAGICSGVFLAYMSYRVLSLVREVSKIKLNRNRILTNFLIDPNINTCLHLPFKYLVLLKSNLVSTSASLSEFNIEKYYSLSQYFDSLVTDGIKKNIHNNYLKDFFAHNLSMLGMINDYNTFEGSNKNG